ncbi:MAG: hypothetical protein K2P81_12710 [Bacteriovoracaceae bacterium]|nr:hypothetical protein [Bacteriovoracaceae bacterium]
MMARLILLIIIFLGWVIFTLLLPFSLAVLACSTLFCLCVLVLLYPDKVLLHLLQARETIESEYPSAYRVARSQAHKFKISAPRIYSYSGFFHRALVLSAKNRLVFVVEKKVLEIANNEELEALFFALALQENQRITKQHTLGLVISAAVWVLPLKFLSFTHFNPKTSSWIIQYFIAPISNTFYKISVGSSLWIKFLKKLSTYKWEESRLKELNSKLEQPRLLDNYSKILTYRFYASHHPPAQQMILAIEAFGHPFDLIEQVSVGTAHA